MASRWRVIDTGALDPFANMAFDEALLRCYGRIYDHPTLRVYGWATPSLSLGYSQDPAKELDIDYCRRMSMPLVRRLTGGGIVLHGNEITYSLVFSKEDLGIPSSLASSYRTICSFLKKFYESLGIETGFACDNASAAGLGRHSAVCVAAQEKYDIVAAGRKIGGNAQKRSGGVIFQHGSIPTCRNTGKASDFLKVKNADEIEDKAATIEELTGKRPGRPELSEALIRSFRETFGLQTFEDTLTSGEEQCFKRLERFKYSTPDWNMFRIDGSVPVRL